MKIKGMWLDGKPNQQPEDTTRINKNIVVTSKFGTVSNEKGFEFLEQLTLKPIGIIRLDANDFVAFSTDNTISEIGIVSNGKYEIRSRDEGLLYKFNFNTEHPIHGDFFLNNEKQRIVSFTDGIGPLRSMNIDLEQGFNQSATQTNSNNPYIIPQLDIVVSNTGQLQSGSYSPIIQFIASDGSTTDWIKRYNPIYIVNSLDDTYSQSTGSESGIVTSKSIQLYINNIDLNYAKFRLGFIYQNKGITKILRVRDYDIGTSQVTFTGEEALIELPTDDVIINKANYKSIQNITSFEDKLYGQGIELYVEPDISQVLNTITAKWYSEKVQLVQQISNPPNLLFASNQNYKQAEYNNKRKSFQHDEVYAFYLRIKWAWGYGKWQLIQGRQVTQDEKTFDFSNLEGALSASFSRFHVQDTCTVDTKTTSYASGNFSGWENTTDGKRHFKFPSLNWMRNNVWNDADYGTKYLDTLGIEFQNVNIGNLRDQDGQLAEGYEIGYAKRGSSRVVSQSIWTPSVVSNSNDGVTVDSRIATGGNWRNIATDYTKTEYFRLYPFDLLRDKLSKVVNFIRVEYKLTGGGFVQKYDDIPALNTITATVTDFVEKGASSAVTNRLTKTIDTRFVPANVITNDYNNTYLEEFYSVKFQAQPNNTVGGIISIKDIPNNSTFTETSHLLTLLNIELDYYLSVSSIVNCDKFIPSNGRNVYFGGDTFLNDSSINVFGVDFTKYTTDFSTYSENPNGFNYRLNGIRSVKRYLFESQFNVNFRYVNNKFELATSFYPKSPILINSKTGNYLKSITKDTNPNDFVNGYEVDFHTTNSFEFSDIYDPTKTIVTNDPFRVVVSEQLNKELDVNVNAWRDFKLNNFYKLDRKRGRVVNFKARNDKLFIHFENSLYQTKPRSILQATDGTPVQLGYGNIFEFDPVPVTHSELGEMGTQHKWSCIDCKHGYVFFDSHKGIWFVVGDGVEAISTKGMYNFFKLNKLNLGDNPFNGNGFTVEFDDYYNRLLVTKKNKTLPANLQSKFRGVWKPDQTFINSLKSGDIVLKNGIYKTIR